MLPVQIFMASQYGFEVCIATRARFLRIVQGIEGGANGGGAVADDFYSERQGGVDFARVTWSRTIGEQRLEVSSIRSDERTIAGQNAGAEGGRGGVHQSD